MGKKTLTELVKLRVSEYEKNKLEMMANQKTGGNVSQYVRLKIFSNKKRKGGR